MAADAVKSGFRTLLGISRKSNWIRTAQNCRKCGDKLWRILNAQVYHSGRKRRV